MGLKLAFSRGRWKQNCAFLPHYNDSQPAEKLKKLFLRVMKSYIILAAAILFTACKSGDSNKVDYTKMPAGTLVAADSMRVVEDTLNNFHFSVRVLTNEKTADKGQYAVKTAWGFNEGETAFTLPKGGEHFTQVLRRQPAPYTYNIGFNMDDDTTFYDYFEVKGEYGTIKMRYTKSYTFK